jgi:hypothetical protein
MTPPKIMDFDDPTPLGAEPVYPKIEPFLTPLLDHLILALLEKQLKKGVQK